MPFDFKREYKEFYMPPKKPGIVKIPEMNYIAVRGKGDPNSEGGEYKNSVGMLYAVAFTIKMSKMGSHKIDGYFDYVVPPLEGFWWQEGADGIIRKPSISYRSFGFRISSRKRNLTGRLLRLKGRRKSTFQRWSSLHMTRGSASSACISVRMMTNR